MKNLKMLYIALIALMAGVLGSCATDPYTAGEQATGPQVCWNSSNPSSFEFQDNDSKIKTLTLSRIDTSEELEVAIVLDYAEGVDETLFSVPETVTFEKGKATAELVFEVHYDKFDGSKNYTIVFKIYPENVTTPYGYSDWTVNFALNPWELMKDSKGNNAKGKFRGADIITTFFSANAEAEIDVNVYKHKSTPGIYKVEDPWLLTFVAAFGYASTEAALADGISYTKKDLVINCEDPAKCYIPQQGMGVDVGYGEFGIWSDYDPVEYPDGIAGVLEEGVLTWAANGIYVSMANYQSGKFYAANAGGMFRLILPGYEVADYSLAVAYDGMDVSADSKVISAKLQFSYGEDVTGIKYIVVPGNIESNPAEALNALINGTAENIMEIANFVQGGKEVGVKVGLETGLYSVVAAPADKNGELRTKEAFVKSFYFPGLGQTVDTTCQFEGEFFLPSEYNPEAVEQFPDQTTLFAELFGKDIKAASYYLNKSAVVATWTDTPESLVAAYGNALPAEYVEMINSEEGCLLTFKNLAENTEWTVIVVATNIYDESKTIVLTKKTAAFEYSGELAIGDYLMYCKYVYGEGAEDFLESASVFNVASNGGSATDFLVTNIGIENGAVWHAKYDSAAGSLTLDGTELGYEEDGNMFGKLYGYYDSAKTMAYGLSSYASAESTGNDPLVLAVDATSKQVSGLVTPEFAVEVVSLADGSFLGYYGYFVNELTTIIPYTPAATASVKSVKREAVVPFRNAKGVRNFTAPKNKFGVNINAGAILKSSAKSVKSVKPIFVENYTPEKKSVGFKNLKETNAVAFRR